MLRINEYTLAPTTSDNVGDWQGREEEAAKRFTTLCVAIAEASTSRYDESWLADPHPDLCATLDHAWDVWGSDAELPDLTPKRIAQIAADYAVHPTPRP